MPRFLDLSSWPRRPHFELFRTYDSPFFNICADVDVTGLRSFVKRSESVSFFYAYLYLSLRAANDIESFRFRIRGDRVLVHDTVHAGSTVLLDNDTFGFVYFDFADDFSRFQRDALDATRRCAEGTDSLNPRDDRDDLIHYSVIPWISFTGVKHARKLGLEDSTPKIVFGKYRPEGERIVMPVSVEVHHGLMDGVHVGTYFSQFEAYLREPEASLKGLL
jgi:chloramphenicol O-acetyltransferase type A